MQRSNFFRRVSKAGNKSHYDIDEMDNAATYIKEASEFLKNATSRVHFLEAILTPREWESLGNGNKIEARF